MLRRRLLPLPLAAAAALVALAGPAVAAPPPVPTGPAAGPPVDGSAGGGDPYFPAAGNGGYQVDDYDLSLRYDPGTAALAGTAVLRAQAGRSLRSFSLDLRDRAMTLVALREEIGERALTTLLRRWATQTGGESVSTADLVALAPRVAHRDLSGFFRTWVDTAGRPTSW